MGIWAGDAVTHPKSECVDVVLKDDAALLRVVRALVENVRDFDNKFYSTSRRRFWDLYTAVEVLMEELVMRADIEPMQSEPQNKYEKGMHLMTRRPDETE